MSDPRPADRVPVLADLVAAALAGVRRPALVLHEPGLAVVVPDGVGEAGPVAVQSWDEPVPPDPPRTVVLVAVDAGSARRAVSCLAGVRWSRCFGIVLRDATRVVPVPRQPLWPAVTSATARLLHGGAVTSLELAARAPGAEVLTALVLGSVPGPTGHGGLRVAGPDPGWAPPADPTVVRRPDPTADLPADVVLRTTGSTTGEVEVNAVTGRAAVAVDPGLGALDPGVWSPAAYDATSDDTLARLDPAARLGVALVADLARRDSVAVDWPASGTDDRAWLRTVAGLALSGVPLVAAEPAPGWARTLLGDDLADALLAGPRDPDARDVRRARLRRAALTTHATPAWRRRVGAAAGVRVAAPPVVQVVGPGEQPSGRSDLVLRHPGGPAPSPDAIELLVAVREATGADVVGVTDGPTEAWGPVDGAGPLLTDPTDATDPIGPDPATGATTYAVPRIALDRR